MPNLPVQPAWAPNGTLGKQPLKAFTLMDPVDEADDPEFAFVLSQIQALRRGKGDLGVARRLNFHW